MSVQFDNKISLGHVISVLVALAAGVTAYSNLKSNQTEHARRIEMVERSQQDREIRLRSLEISVSSQATDLRNIQAGIADIKAGVEKLMSGR